MNTRLILLALLLLIAPATIYAHPGRTDSSGGHYCWTNCSYWGETYGAWHSHGGTSSYSSYTPTYTSTYKSNSDCPSYGFAYLGSCYELPAHARKSAFSGFTCDYGYEEVGYGLSKQCLPEIENGYRIGSFIYCDYGYQLYGSSCLKKGYSGGYYSSLPNYSLSDFDFGSSYSCPKNSTEDPSDSSKCLCNLGYELNKVKDGCKKTSSKTNDKLCQADFGKNSKWTGKYDKEENAPTCQCKKGFSWNSGMTSCVK